MTRRAAIRLIGAGLGLLLLVAAWWFLAPRQLGGSSTYAIIVGSSMEPSIERGDLVIVRKNDRYEVGDIVAYRSANLREVVLHRIVGRSGDRYVFKGDANDFTDSERPARDGLVGELWIQIPVAGTAFQWLRTPRNAAVVGAAAMFLLLAGGAGARKRRRGPGLAGRETRRVPGPGRAGSVHPFVQTAVVFLGVAVLAFAVLGVAAFTRPSSHVSPPAELYRQSGAFSYAAVAPETPVYDTTELTTGDALFLALVDEVSLAFQYRFDSAAPHSVSGTVALAAELTDGNGWTRTLELEPPTRFSGDQTRAAGRLDLRELERLVEKFETITETARDTYLVTVTPRVELRGAVEGRPVDEAFAPSVTFMLDPSRFVIAPDAVLNGRKNDLTPARSTQGRERVEPAGLSLLGTRLEVATARTAAVAGGVAALAALVAVGLLGLRRRNESEPERIRARFEALLVSVTSVDRARAESVVTVATMEALARLAERHERVILHEERGGLQAYSVEEGGVVYLYEAREGVRPEGARKGVSPPKLAETP